MEIETKPYLGDRIVAGFLDYLLICGFLFYYAINFGEPNEDGGYHLTGISAFAPVVFWGIITIGSEQLFGATVGNLLVGLKPLSIDENTHDYWGNRVTFSQSLKRHLLDPVDMFFFGIVGIVTISNSDKHQRVGDIWAKTIVIRKADLEN
ncbi:RDD family protein [Pseudotenacibaculum haliotis]|uniref:RDD family protein n=1 Tax=Pseudotenacibaculum haliotis TaxID=1862138 RepID=A0ABW5LNL5_9FLAO